jgi:Domain of unknown function (DUF4372)/Transposase DDE domain
MNRGRTVFAQLIEYVSHNEFHRCVARYDGDHRVRKLSCWEQFLAMAFAQLTYRESLRDIEVSLAVHRRKLYHAGFRSLVKKSTLADANEIRDWRIYADFAQSLIQIARPLYADSDLGLDLQGTVYALDSTTIDLCLALFPWASFRRAKGAVKLHTMIDVQSAIPVFIDITHGKIHDVEALDHIVPEPGSYVVMDRGYTDFARLYHLNQAFTYFVIRARRDLQFQRRRSTPVDKSVGLRSDQTIVLTGPVTSQRYPAPLRRISYYALDIDKRFVFLTNDFFLPPLTVAEIYRCRWQIELFFKWINKTCASSASSVLRPTALRSRFGSPSPFISWLPFSKSNSTCNNLYTQSCKFSPQPFSRKPPSRLCFSAMTTKSRIKPPLTS